MSKASIAVDVLVVGGGASGAAAAWQAARLGVRVLVVEPTPWLGGMVSSAGVSALDGNEGALGSGFFGRFRARVEAHYGGAANVRTGWVSNTCFEPRVAARIVAELVEESGVEVWLGCELVGVLRERGRIAGALVAREGALVEVRAAITIEASECGDVLAFGDVPHRLGREARAESGEPDAPERADDELQDLTFVAICKRFEGRAPAVARPTGFDVREFDCATREICSRPDERELNHGLHDWTSFLGYGRLPGDKFMLNWPFHSNDSRANGMFDGPAARAECIAQAKARTLAFVSYMQTELGHPEWGLADDEFDTPDRLPYQPYVRESRRLVPWRWMREQDVVPAPGDPRPPMQPDAIAVGDYFLDHHHSAHHLPLERRLIERFPKNAPFQIPYSALVPRALHGLIAAEKSIGVTHIVNGCTRLQPVVMLIGQAAGAAAALCVRERVEPRELRARSVQDALLEERVMLTPMLDVDDARADFAAIQRLALRGLTRSSDPLRFEPDSTLTLAEAESWCARLESLSTADRSYALAAWRPGSTRGEFALALDALAHGPRRPSADSLVAPRPR